LITLYDQVLIAQHTDGSCQAVLSARNNSKYCGIL